VKSEEDKQIASLVTLPVAIGYNYWLAPEVPAERMAILRKAFEDTMRDPEMIAEAKRQLFEIRPKKGEELQAMVQKAAQIPKPILQKTAAILGW
jgi:tripartite-type tricarboxylate transporter receptor subunit TctC